jgi:hypothetical protein
MRTPVLQLRCILVGLVVVLVHVGLVITVGILVDMMCQVGYFLLLLLSIDRRWLFCYFCSYCWSSFPSASLGSWLLALLCSAGDNCRQQGIMQ